MKIYKKEIMKNKSGMNYMDIGLGFFSGFGGMMFESEEEHKARKTGNTETKWGVIDTCYANDTSYYETGIEDSRYADVWIIVEEYETKEESIKGHKKWVKRMNSKNPPKELEDVHGSGVYSIKKL